MADSSKQPRIGASSSESGDDAQAGQSWYCAVSKESCISSDGFYDAGYHAQRTGKAPYWRGLSLHEKTATQ
jgi:hypothetical protein